MTHLDKLISIAGGPLSHDQPTLSARTMSLGGMRAKELLELLSKRNGFYAFEGALHVFPVSVLGPAIGIEQWNDAGLWRGDYPEISEEALFFAEDIFGGQFCIEEDRVFSFDPETGQLEHLADDLDGWAKAILMDYEVLTGHPLAKSWQVENGRLPEGRRLVPITPFVMGGEFSIGNLRACDAVQGMRLRAEIAAKIRDLPDGASVAFGVSD
ncbi:MAG: SMI1/KNR4 family protein [Pseudomonadota bacterium]